MLLREQEVTYPNIGLGTDIKTTIFIDHLRRSVHHGRIALIWFKNFIYRILVYPLMNQSCSACWAKVTEFEFFVMQKHILNLDISVGDRRLLIMHHKDSSTDIFHNMDDLSLTQAFSATFYDQVEQCAIFAKLTHDTDLVHTSRSLFYLSFIYCDYILMPTQLSPHLHFICNQSPLLFALCIDLFKGIFLTSLSISYFVDKAEATLRN